MSAPGVQPGLAMPKYSALLTSLATWSFAISGASAQFLSLGVKGAVPVNAPYYSSDESKRYIVGPSIEFRLPANFAVEASALYQRTGYSASFLPVYILGESGMPTGYSTRQRGNSWQFPVLGKYYFGSRRPWQPFLGTGYAVRTTWTHSDTQYTTVNAGASTTQAYAYDSRSPLDVGVVFAAGLRLRAGKVKIAPEMRFTRWGAADFQTRKNSATFLLGFSF